MDTDPIKQRFAKLEPFLNERLRRLYAATEAQALGYGGISAVARATGCRGRPSAMALRNWLTPDRAMRIRKRAAAASGRWPKIRPCSRSGAAGRTATRGDPESPLRWTCKSVRKLAENSSAKGTRSATAWWPNCCRSWATACRPTARRGRARTHPDRNAQFEHINAQVAGLPRRRAAGHLGGHQEEGTGGRLQERRARMASPRRPRSRCGCMTS